MSYTTLYYVTPTGRTVAYKEFSNSHRGAMMVWGNLWEMYCKDRIEEVKKTMLFSPSYPVTEKDFESVWALFKNKNINKSIRAVLASTFDHVVLEKPYFQDFYNDVLKYSGSFAAGTLIEQAQEIVALKNKPIIGVCWNQTSVVSSWEVGNINKWDHWFLYSELNKLIESEKASQ